MEALLAWDEGMRRLPVPDDEGRGAAAAERPRGARITERRAAERRCPATAVYY